MIKILHNSKLIGKFNKLTATFRCGLSLEDILSNEKVQLAFMLEKGALNAETIKLMTNNELNSARFTIQFTLENKNYSINKAVFDFMTAIKNVEEGILLFSKQISYSRIEGVGELAAPKEFPVEFIKYGFTIDE